MSKSSPAKAASCARQPLHLLFLACDAVDLALDIPRDDPFAHQHPLLRCEGPHVSGSTDALRTVSNETGSFIAVEACAGGDSARTGNASKAQIPDGHNDDVVEILEEHGNDTGGCFCAHLGIGILSFRRDRAPGAGNSTSDCVLS